MKRLNHFLALLACVAVAVSCFPEKTVSVEGIDIFPAVVNLKVGETAPILITVTPENATDKNYNLTTTDPEMSVFAIYGTTVKAIAPGDGSIIATTVDGGKTAICRVVVSANDPTDPVIHVASVMLLPSEANMTVGDELVFEVIIEPDEAADRTLTWSSSDESVATVSDGKVTAVGSGNVTISAVSVDNPEAVGRSEITVVAAHIPVTGIAISDMAITMHPAEYYTLTATVEPGDATNPEITWESSDPAKVHCLDDGEIIAYGVGKATVTARSVDNPEISASCEVTVEPIIVDVQGIIVNTPASIEMKTGDAPFHIDVTVVPEDATDKTLKWESDKTDVATVDDDGNVTPVAPGEAVIHVSSVSNPEVYAECVVKVIPSFIPVEHIYLNLNYIPFYEGDPAVQIGYTVEPENATDPTLVWASSNESVATVADGLVTPVGPGEATITATSVSNPEISEFCSVSVISTAVSVTGISISASSLAMQVGDLRKLSCTVQPSDATNKAVKWSSGDESVAYVDKDGEVVAMGNGSTTIQVKTDDGGITAYCSVTVTQSFFELKSTVNKKNYVYDFVDMGFSSKTCWSNKNLYAVRPAENGALFAWANPLPDDYPFTWDNYIWGNGGNKQLSRYNWDSAFGAVDGNTSMLNDDNPVYFIVGGSYPCDMPTAAQIQELINNTTRVPAAIDGHSGMLFKSKIRDRAIFIPAAGVTVGEVPSMEGMSGGAWSKELSDSNPTTAKALSFYTDTQECAVASTSRFFGIPIRAVYNRP